MSKSTIDFRNTCPAFSGKQQKQYKSICGKIELVGQVQEYIIEMEIQRKIQEAPIWKRKALIQKMEAKHAAEMAKRQQRIDAQKAQRDRGKRKNLNLKMALRLKKMASDTKDKVQIWQGMMKKRGVGDKTGHKRFYNKSFDSDMFLKSGSRAKGKGGKSGKRKGSGSVGPWGAEGLSGGANGYRRFKQRSLSP